MSKQVLTTQDIDRGVDAATSELEVAKAAYNKAALAYAQDRQSQALQDALVASKRKVDLLEGEIAGLKGARTESERVESVAELQGRIKDIKAARARAEELFDAIPPALDKVAEAAVALGKAAEELRGLGRSANYAVANICEMTGARSPATPTFRMGILIDGLMWLHTPGCAAERSSLVVTSGGKYLYDGPANQAARSCANARARIDQRCRSNCEELGEQIKALEPPGAA